MKKVCIIIAVLLVVFKIGTSFANEEKIYKKITLKPSDKVMQGGTIFINIKSPEELKNPIIEFKDRTYKLFSRGENKYTGHIGIGALEKPGEYKISMRDETGNLQDKAYIKIMEKDFPNQYLTISKSTASLRGTPHEFRQINRMKSTISDEFLASAPPYESPTEGCINSVFGLKRYYNGKFSGNYHKGIDIKTGTGTPVKSITGGKVIFAENFRLHGGSVAVDHGNGIVSLYIHLSKIDVKAGEHVKERQKLGEVGATGFATGPHLHWGLYVNGTAVDPMTDWVKPVKICM